MNRTPLFALHRDAGARLVDFAGWEMPVQYAGILAEHRAVREQAGLFDVSHMGQIEVRGSGALAELQSVTGNDVGRLSDGQAQYSLLILDDGGIVDDIIVYRLADERYLLCVNASNREADMVFLREQIRDAEVIDRSDEFALLALQGPVATRLLNGMTEADLTSVSPFSFVESTIGASDCLLARTGYTGEDGWEIYCSPDAAGSIWQAILDSGRNLGVVPAGLGARDTLRLEAALPLYGHELSRDTSPLEARLGWVVRLDKGDFLGRAALLRQKHEGPRRKLVGLVVQHGGVPRQGYRILDGESAVGEVTSGTRSPTLGKGIALGYVEPHLDKRGTSLAVEVRGRPLGAEVVKLPFYRRAKAD
jgi:aminomethyltransferase